MRTDERDIPPVIARGYAERQLVVVVPEPMVKPRASEELRGEPQGGFGDRVRHRFEIHKAAQNKQWDLVTDALEKRDWSKAAISWFKYYTNFRSPHSHGVDEVTTTSLNALVKFAEWSKSNKIDKLILPVGKTEAKAIAFPPGHPRTDVLYVGHPAIPNVYYPMADFHRATFEHKFCEAIELLMSLGATQIRVQHVTGWSSELKSKISAPIGSPTEEITLDVGRSSNNRRNLLYEASLSGNKNPTIPGHLVWYPHEPTWQTLARGRIDFGLRDFSLKVTYEDDYGVNVKLKGAVAKAGFEIGGEFEQHQSTVWNLEGKFGT